MPKSSRLISTSRASSATRVSMTLACSTISVRSVSSRRSSEAGTRCRASDSDTAVASHGPCRSRADTLTATGTSMPSVRHSATCASASSTTNAVSRCMSPEVSASGMNSSGGDVAARLGCCHRTSASTPTTAPETSDTSGWKCSSSWSRVERAAQRGQQAEPVGGVEVVVGVVHLDAGLQPLGQVHRDVGASHQLVRLDAVLRVHRDADAGLHLEHHLLEGERLDQRVADPAGQLDRLAVRRDPRQVHRELVAAQARHHVVRAQHAPDALREQREQLVADVVPERVVDLLEPVQVQQAQHERRRRTSVVGRRPGAWPRSAGPSGTCGSAGR